MDDTVDCSRMLVRVDFNGDLNLLYLPVCSRFCVHRLAIACTHRRVRGRSIPDCRDVPDDNHRIGWPPIPGQLRDSAICSMVSMGMVHTLHVSNAFAAVLVDGSIFSTWRAGMATLKICIQNAASKVFFNNGPLLS